MTRFLDRAGWALAGALALALMLVLGSRLEAGPLDPPEPPGSTAGVRQPGTPISSLPFTISQPGHYYLTQNLFGAPGPTGIRINAWDVTLDLNGFALDGSTGSGDGITTSSTVFNVVIRNGSVANWTQEGIDLFFAIQARVENVTVRGNDGVGIKLGQRGILQDCAVNNNGIAGVFVENGLVTRCQVGLNDDGIQASDHSRIVNNMVNGQGTGIHLFGDLNIVENNTITGNTRGIMAPDGLSNMIIRNVMSNTSNFFNVNGSTIIGIGVNGSEDIGGGSSPYANFIP